MYAFTAIVVVVVLLILVDCNSLLDTAVEGGLGVAPEGIWWVGMNDVVVVVFDWWMIGDICCNELQEDIVYYDFAGIYECAMDGPSFRDEVFSFAVLDGAYGTGEFLLREMCTVNMVFGREVKELGECNEWFLGICWWVFAVFEEGVVFAVIIDDSEDGSYEEICDSLRILPDGLIMVSLRVGGGGGYIFLWGVELFVVVLLVNAFEVAGLVVEIEVVEVFDDGGDYATFPEGSLFGVEFLLGSVVKSGLTVTVTVLGILMVG